MLDPQCFEDLASLLQRRGRLRGIVRAQGWAEVEKAKAQRNPAAMREHEQIFGQAPRIRRELARPTQVSPSIVFAGQEFAFRTRVPGRSFLDKEPGNVESPPGVQVPLREVYCPLSSIFRLRTASRRPLRGRTRVLGIVGDVLVDLSQHRRFRVAHQDRHRQRVEAALQRSRRPRVADGVHAVLPAVLGERACARRSDTPRSIRSTHAR